MLLLSWWALIIVRYVPTCHVSRVDAASLGHTVSQAIDWPTWIRMQLRTVLLLSPCFAAEIRISTAAYHIESVDQTFLLSCVCQPFF